MLTNQNLDKNWFQLSATGNMPDLTNELFEEVIESMRQAISKCPGALGPSRMTPEFEQDFEEKRYYNKMAAGSNTSWFHICKEGVPSIVLQFRNGPILLVALQNKPREVSLIIEQSLDFYGEHAVNVKQAAVQSGKTVLNIDADYPTARGSSEHEVMQAFKSIKQSSEALLRRIFASILIKQ